MDKNSKKRSHQDLGSTDGPKAKKFKASAQPEENGKSANGSGSTPSEILSFPRGEKKRTKGDRESVVLPTKKKQDRDLLFDSKRLEEQLEEKENSKKKRRRSKGKKEKKEDDELFDDMQLDEDEEAEIEGLVTEATKPPKRIELLKPSGLVEGVLLFGCIREINDLYLNISLPNNLKGSVSITEVSDSLNTLLEREANDEEMNEDLVPSLFSLFKVGQFVKCAVHKVQQRKISLTLRESVLNASLSLDSIAPGMPVYGSVKSAEDHGYVISLGVEGINAFIPKKFLTKKKKDGEEGEPEETKLVVGQLVDGLVSEVKKEAKTVFINPNQDRVATKITKEVSGLTLETLKPGMLVQAYIQAVLADGLWVKFLGYFAGGISMYHLDKTYTSEELAKTFKNGQKIPARIMHVDSENKSVSLSMKKSIIQLQPFAFDDIDVGDIFDEAIIRRIDAPIGVLLEVKPVDDGEPILGYAHVSKLTDGNFEKVFKTMEVGEKVQCRVLSFNYVDELVNVSLRKSDIEQKFLRYEDIKPGQQLTATVSKITEQGLILKITEFIRAYMPKFHAADITIENFQARFSVGGKVACRALMVDPTKKRLIVTHKRALINSDLPVLSSYDDAKEDMVVHGTIVAVGPFGCRLRFYGDVTALAPISELSAGYVHDPVKMFQPGLVKKCRIISVTPKQRRLIVSFLMDKENEQTEEWTRVFDSIKTGQFIDGVVTQSSERGIDVKIGGQVEAFIPAYHLSDHRAHFALLAKRFKVGDKITDMLVLRVRPQKKYIGLTLKPSIKAAAKANKIPKSFDEVKKDETYFGVVKKITNFGVIVRFMNQIQGLSLRMNLADVFISNPEEFFYVGQTVRAHVTEVIPETSQFSFTLRQSFAASQDSEFIDSYFAEEATLEKPKTNIDWNKYKVGTIVKGTVTDVADYGVILSLDAKVKGFAHVKQVVGKVQPGSEVECVILDIDKFKSIVDVSLRTELINQVRGDGSGKALEPLKKDNQVDAVVELIKANYLILSLSGKHSNGNKSLIAYASTRDYNTEVFADPFNAYRPLQKVTAVVKKAPSNDRIILAVTSGFRQKKGLSALAANAINTIDDVEVGSLVKVQVKRIYDNQMTVTVGMHVQGRVHISEATDDINETNPFSKYSVGQVIEEARVVSFSSRKSNKYLPITHQDAGKMKVVEVSLRPSVVKQWNDKPNVLPTFENLQKGQIVNGWIHKLTPDGMWVYLSSTVRGRVFILDASNDINVLRNIGDHFKPCQGIRCKVLSIDVDKQALDLSIKALANEANKAATPDKVKPGMIIPARVMRVKLNEAVTVQLFSHTYGRAYITDLFDNYVKDPIAEFVAKEREIVNCYVLEVNKDDNQIDVSLRPSRVNPALQPEVKYPEITSMQDVTPGIIVQGYIKHTANNTIYVALSRNVTGRVFFKNLSNKFIKNPSKMYPIGKLVTGRVISINDDFIDLSLKKSDVQQKRMVFEDLKVDQVVKGFVKRLDSKFGVFVTLKDCGLVGLCHLSEVDDEYVKPEELKNRFKIKDAVKARVIRLNAAKKQISLTLKPSRLEGVEDSESSKESDEESDEEVEEVEEVEDKKKKNKKEKESDKKGKKAKVLTPVDGDDSDDDAILNEARDEDEDDSDEMEQDNEDDEDNEDEDENQEEEEESSEEVKPQKNKKETKKRDLSQRILTPSGYVFGEDHMSDSDDENYVSKLAEQVSGDDDDDEEMAEGDEDNSGDNDNEDEEDDDAEEEAMEVEQDQESEEEVKKSSKKSSKQPKTEGISVGFDWNGTGDKEESDEDSDDEETTSKKKPVVAKPQSEETDGDGLNTAEDFEKALFANPNSSYLWIRFIAYWLGVTEVDKAREVAERALKRIEARLGDEKLNVWIAYMNLENTYGTPQSLTEVFQRACTYNDPKRVHLELIKIHTNSGNAELATELYKSLVKKYKDSKRVWLKYGLFKFKQGQPEAARNILDRSLKSLAKRKHLEVISKFAQYEYKHGAIERGRTIFENILSTYPKRLDLWSVYIDMEVVAQAFDKARSVFERVATLNLSSKKMRFIFKKWLQFEKEHGTVKQQEHVKQRATEYVESRSQK